MSTTSALIITLTTVAFVICAAGWGLTARHLRRAQRELAQVTQRPALLSHEIRTPLSLIKGAGELLAERTPGPLTPQQEVFVTTITQNTQQVINIAEDFLADARLDTGKLECGPVDIRALVATTARELRRIHGVTITVDSRGGPLIITGDATALRQVVWNLVNNAARHAGPDAHISVHVQGRAESVSITVADDGEGMDRETLAELFTPFHSGGSRRPGTGIGMAVAQRIVTAHGGTIMVDTLPQRGTAIVVSLPAPSSPPPGSPTPPTPLRER